MSQILVEEGRPIVKNSSCRRPRIAKRCQEPQRSRESFDKLRGTLETLGARYAVVLRSNDLRGSVPRLLGDDVSIKHGKMAKNHGKMKEIRRIWEVFQWN